MKSTFNSDKTAQRFNIRPLFIFNEQVAIATEQVVSGLPSEITQFFQVLKESEAAKGDDEAKYLMILEDEQKNEVDRFYCDSSLYCFITGAPDFEKRVLH
ncbi:MAG: hypothetical protein HAW67_03610 [Endozoicomonadaceae bacterium]|nr:hypothetical protein [Endozoicomonadaceae bacterium]